MQMYDRRMGAVVSEGEEGGGRGEGVEEGHERWEG